jgi:hypothetical protein
LIHFFDGHPDLMVHCRAAKTFLGVENEYLMSASGVIPHASPHYFPFGNYDSHIWVITVHAEPLRKSIHFLHQYTPPFATLTSVLCYKEGLYISTQHHSKHQRGSPFTSLRHHHLVRVEIITIYFSSYSFHSTLISTSLFTSVRHTAI